MARLSGSILAACAALVVNGALADGPLSIGTKILHLDGERSDPAFFDASGRELVLHGWNVSGSVKLASRGFKPFENADDAARSFALMRQHTGANLVRFTLSWEGTHPQVDTLDTVYLDTIAQQMKAAIAEGMYLFLDYHTDLYSRHLFGPNDTVTGNGAPRWIIEGGDYRLGGCGVLCFSWSMHTILNQRVRAGYRNFWDNAAIYTLAGERRVQDEFLWQLRQSLLYLKDKFSADEWDHILGVQPFNEPTYGRGHINKADEFDNDKLWPFYRRVRAVMDDTGWQQQWVYAEPHVFWHTNVGFFTPPTGGHYLRDIPESGYVFAPHFYDAARMGITNLNRVENAEYFHDIDYVRDETRFLNMPVVIGEFGMWLHDQNGGSKDYARTVNAVYQALEASDRDRPDKDRRLDFYTMTVSGTQWHWDIYKDQHQELRNGNADAVMRDGDGWNGEDFSAIKGDALTVGADIVSRIYPRAVQGRLVNFFYHPAAKDGAGKLMDWAAIDSGGQRYFAESPFALVTWQGIHSDQPTEIFIPPQFAPQNIQVITANEIWRPGEPSAQLSLQTDRQDGEGGHVLRVYADSATAQDLHFALIVVGAAPVADALQASLVGDIQSRRHPVFLTGRMADPNYVADPAQAEAVNASAKALQFLVFRQVQLRWDAPGPVAVIKNGKIIHHGKPEGRAAFFSLVGLNEHYRLCLQNLPTQCSQEFRFH